MASHNPNPNNIEEDETAEETDVEKLAKLNKQLEDKISQIRILVSDETQLELHEELKGLVTKNDKLNADNEKYLTDLAELKETLQAISHSSRTQQTTVNSLSP